MKEHQYEVQVTWTGNNGNGTSRYTAYARDFSVEAPGKSTLEGSADPAFRGNPLRWDPEDLLVAGMRRRTMSASLPIRSISRSSARHW
ncbi:OsmC family protein [Pseudomonas sp. TE21394]